MGRGKVADHLAAFHKHAAEHHDTLHACYSKIAGFGKASKSDMKDGDGGSLADCLQKIADTHADAAEFHKGMMAECSKSMDPEFSKAASPEFEKRLAHLENTMAPTQVSGVAPDNPMRGLSAVPRFGARPIADRPAVPLQFEKLSQIEE